MSTFKTFKREEAPGPKSNTQFRTDYGCDGKDHAIAVIEIELYEHDEVVSAHYVHVDRLGPCDRSCITGDGNFGCFTICK